MLCYNLRREGVKSFPSLVPCTNGVHQALSPHGDEAGASLPPTPFPHWMKPCMLHVNTSVCLLI